MVSVGSRVENVAGMLGLTPFLGRKPHALSGGQRQRVALGRAIVRDPKVFLFDEPLSNLDAALRVSTRNELVKQHQRLGATMIYVTHDQVEAMTMGQRICIINNGKLVQVGVPLQVYREPADTFVAKFLGNPPMNLFKVRLEASADGVAARFGNYVLPLPAMDATKLTAYLNQTVILGIRPEDLSEIRLQDRHQHPSSFTARVAAVEALGAETVLIMEIEAVEEFVRARLDRDSTARLGDEICIEADVNRVHLFDPQSSRAIACR